DGGQRQRDWHDNVEQVRDDLWRYVRYGVLNRLLQVLEDESTFLNASNSACKIVIQENHRCGFLGDVRSGHVHSNAQISLLQCGRVVDAVTSNTNDVAHALCTADDFQLVLWRRASKDDLVLHEDVVPLVIR